MPQGVVLWLIFFVLLTGIECFMCVSVDLFVFNIEYHVIPKIDILEL